MITFCSLKAVFSSPDRPENVQTPKKYTLKSHLWGAAASSKASSTILTAYQQPMKAAVHQDSFFTENILKMIISPIGLVWPKVPPAQARTL
jgi:hypothetical protein